MNSLNHTVRIVDFTIEVDEDFKIENLFLVKSFIEKYRHPDIDLNLVLNFNSFKLFKDITSVLVDINCIKTIRSEFIDIDKETLDIISRVYNEIVIVKSNFNKSEDFNLIYFVSRKKNTVVEYIMNEKNSSLYEFMCFYNDLHIRSTYSIDYFYKYENKKVFLEKILEDFKKIINQNKGYIREIHRISAMKDPYKSMVFYKDLIGHTKYDNLVRNNNVDENSFKNFLSKKDLNKCVNCPSILFCNGGDYSVFEHSENSDLFCAVNMGLSMLLIGENNEKNDCRM